jgi:hypothetical protein
MKLLLKAISVAGLVMTVVPAFLVLYGAITWTAHARLMVMGMVCWFATAPFWMRDE